jgi:hypothetical protein
MLNMKMSHLEKRDEMTSHETFLRTLVEFRPGRFVKNMLEMKLSQVSTVGLRL